jgi:protein arginine kinase activator
MIGIVCQLCSKRPATSHLTELDDAGQRRELHLCATCIEQFDLKLESDPPPIVDLLKKAGPKPPEATEEDADDEVEEALEEAEEEVGDRHAACSTCGLAFAEFTVNNRFGCARCYADFGAKVEGLLSRYHGASLHVGRTPAARGGGADELVIRRAKLDAALREAVASEAYEKAARLRDEIRKLDDSTP